MFLRRTAAGFIAVLMFAQFASGDSIILRSAVRLAHDGEHVRLSDVATLKGESAKAHAEVVIGRAPRAGEVIEISLGEIRAALEEAGVHWGRTNLNGRTVVVRAGRSACATAPRAMVPIALAEVPREDRVRQRPTAHLASELIAEDNLRGAVAEYMARALNIDPDRLRLTFDDRDSTLLLTALAERRFEIEPVSSVHSARVDLAIRAWERDRVVDRRTVSVIPSVSMPVMVVTRDVERGATLSHEDIQLQHQWHSPLPNNGGLVSVREEAEGRAVVMRLREGDVIRQSHLQRETIVRRGELVVVRCIVGGAVISLQAEARANASEGDTVEFRKPGERDTFLATVTGRGAAMVDFARRP